MEIELFSQLTLTDFLDAVPAYQREQIWDAIGVGVTPTPERAEEIAWSLIPVNSATTTFPFGGERNLKPLLAQINEEVRKLLCTNDPSYEKERAQLISQFNMLDKKAAVAVIVNAISVAIAVKLGVIAGLLTGPIALLLFAISKITLRAWCARGDVAPLA